MNEQNQQELESLLLDWEAGTLNDEGIQRTRELLRASPEARQFYIQSQLMTAALKLEGDSGAVPDEHISIEPGDRGVRPKKWWSGVTFAVASILIAALGARVLYFELARPDSNSGAKHAGITDSPAASRQPASEATSRGIALLTRLVDVQWGDDETPLEVGDALESGRFAIQSGFAQVEFFCGATVVLEGPAVMQLKSPTLAQVESGKLRVQVPPAARGFSLEVQGMKVVDLGTEFGLAVTSDGAADLQVFDGEVELHRKDSTPRRLITGESIRKNDSGVLAESNLKPSDFLDIAALETRSSNRRAERFQRWKSWSRAFRQDARLITYYAFDEEGDWQRKLNSSLAPVNSELDGAIVGAQRTVGRWAGKSALDFKRPGDRVRVQIPGEYSSLTLCCWVKIDSLDRWYNSLFLTDGYQRGEPHWQILDSGQLFFSVRVSEVDGGPEHREVLSAPFWSPQLSGKWLHLATTYDVQQKQVCHYLNGQQIHVEQIPDEQLASTTRFGKATIGNWTSPQRPDEDFAIRNLNGSIDEFALFADVLSEEEIAEMYEYGKP